MAASDYARAAIRLPHNQPGHYDPETHRLCITAMQASQREFTDTCTYLFNADAGAFDPWTRVEDVEPDQEGGAVLLHLPSGAVRSVPGTHPIYLGRGETEQWLAKVETEDWQLWLHAAGSPQPRLADTGNEMQMRGRWANLLVKGMNAWLLDPLGFRAAAQQPILSRAEARAALTAMRTLNAIGARLDVRVPDEGPRRIWQFEHAVRIESTFPDRAAEFFDDVAQFATTYQIKD